MRLFVLVHRLTQFDIDWIYGLGVSFGIER